MIDAIDRAETEIAKISNDMERRAASKEHIIQAAIHILFESQVDVLIDLLDEPPNSARITFGDQVIR